MLALLMALALLVDLLILIRGLPGAESRTGPEGEMPISFPISLEFDECYSINW